MKFVIFQSSTRALGPSPPHADWMLAGEAEERRVVGLQQKRIREYAEDKDRAKDTVDSEEISEAGMLEKRGQTRQGQDFQRGDDGSMEVDEGTLMGSGDSFRQRCGFYLTSIPYPIRSFPSCPRFCSCH
jgi:hypothetical protein